MLARLEVGPAEIESGSRVARFDLGQPDEQRLGLGRNRSARHPGQRFGKTADGTRIVSGEALGAAERLDGAWRIAQNRARAPEHQPALQVVRRLGQPGLQPRHHLLDIRLLRAFVLEVLPHRQGRSGSVRRAEDGIECVPPGRHEQGCRQHDTAPAGRRPPPAPRFASAGDPEQPALDLEARRPRLSGGDQAALEVALDLGQLVAIDLELEAVARPTGAGGGTPATARARMATAVSSANAGSMPLTAAALASSASSRASRSRSPASSSCKRRPQPRAAAEIGQQQARPPSSTSRGPNHSSQVAGSTGGLSSTKSP